MRGLAAGLLLIFDLLGARASWPAQLLQWSIASPAPVASPSATIALAMSLPYAISPTPYAIAAEGALVVDADTNQVILEKNSHTARPIASITKLATILVILRDHSLDETVTVPTLPAYGATDAKIGLVAGEKFTLHDLLAAALIPSANDAADTLAIYDAGSISKFVDKMNTAVSEWGIGECHFSNASGLVDEGNNASPQALVKIAELVLSNSTVKTLVQTQSSTITNLSGKPYTLATTNHLLQDKRFSGIKTGYTIAAGQSLVTGATVSGHRIITVVLASPDRFGETLTMVNFLEKTYSWQNFKP